MEQNLAHWLNHIESFHPAEIELGLDRIGSLAEKLDLLRPVAKVVIVGGTNGKGSCVAMLESLAISRNIQVACYTSPHLLEFNERIRINGENIDDQSLVNAFSLIEKERGETPLTFFEFTTLAALLIFKQIGLELIVLEVGLGGRLDAVNIVEPDISVITTIDIDHTDWLGNSLVSIATEKAGIARAGKTTLVGDKKSYSLLKDLKQMASVNLELVAAANDSQVRAIADSALNRYRLMEQNVLLAYQAIGLLFPEQRFSLSTSLSKVKLSGRFQLLDSNFPTIIDVAHNPQAVARLANQLQHFVEENGYQKVIAICGMMADKAIGEVLTIIQPHIDQWCFVDLPIKRAISGEKLLAIYRAHHFVSPADTYSSVKAAVEQCYSLPEEKQLILVFGSFITVSNMIQYHHSLQAL